jgi:hypothetical protein
MGLGLGCDMKAKMKIVFTLPERAVLYAYATASETEIK